MRDACTSFFQWPAKHRLFRLAAPPLLALAGVANLFGAPQDPASPPTPDRAQQGDPGNAATEPPAPPAPTVNVSRAAVHGVVRNSVTGEPLPRALVRIEGDAVAGALTDGEGRFEISGVPLGPEAFQVMKPGFIDPASAGMGGPQTVVNGASNSEHNVYVASEMADLVFSLAPTNAIRGQIALSSGDPAQSIAVLLLRRAVQDGRAVWQPVTNVRTNSEGGYRFAGLADGIYAMYTEPAMESDIPAAFVEAGSERGVTRSGYPSMFYPDARDLTGAAKIQVSGGQQAQANLLLTEEPFHMVRANLTLPGNARPDAQLSVNVTLLDAQGHQLPYSGQYDQATHTVQAFLPDGSYTLQVTTMGMPSLVHFGDRRVPDISSGRRPDENNSPEGPLIGRAEFSVEGRSVTHLQIPLAMQRSNTIQLSLLRSGVSEAGVNNAQAPPIVVMLSQAGGWITDGMVSSYAEGYATGPIETTSNMGPGSYWVHTSIPQKSVCEGSFTAGGASLAREPLVLGLTGVTAPLTLTLRDDCASLKVSLPPDADVSAAGDEPNYTIYVVPDFDSTTDITPVVLRPSSGGSMTLGGLTPGSYHVYAFASPVELEYRNPEALAALPHPGQAITLSPGASSSLVVEVPGH